MMWPYVFSHLLSRHSTQGRGNALVRLTADMLDRLYVVVAVGLQLGGFVLLLSGDSLGWLAAGMAITLYTIVFTKERVRRIPFKQGGTYADR